MAMEYLAIEDQDLAKKGLEELRGKLRSPQQDVLERLKSQTEEFRFARAFRIAEEYTNRNLQTAGLIWDYLLERCGDRLQKIAVMNKLFRVQIATGPWNAAFETAQNLFNETTEFHLESARQKTTGGQSLDPTVEGRQLFNASMNMATIRRLRKEIQAAEELYRKASEVAASIDDFDKETLAKVHLAICLLDRGELKEAIESYFEPLMASKSSLSRYTQAIYLQSYGNACRSAADWGRAKEFLREALELAKELKDAGLVSSCCGDLGNVFRSEGRYRDAERLHNSHYTIALNRGDTHGLAIACGNIGFLKFYNPEEFDDSLVYQFIEYSLAEQVGDFARMGISFNKIGKLYTTLGYYEEAVKLFEIAVTQAQKAGNVAGEGMAWGNLGTVYRALEQYEDAIDCHVKYRDNAERRMDIGGLAIMQHQLAMDYYLCGNLPEAESSILGAFQTLEQVRSQIGEEDKSKISNFEKNQSEAYNLLQVLLIAQKKYKEAFVLADASRGRSLSDIVQRRIYGSTSSETSTKYLDEEFIDESFNNLLQVGQKLSTSLVLYSVVKEFDQTGAVWTWVYTWVLQLNGKLHFCKTRLQGESHMKVELNDDLVIQLSRSMGLPSQSRGVSEILRGENLFSKPKGRKLKAPLPSFSNTNDEVFKTLKGLKDMFSSDWESGDEKENFIEHYLGNVPLKSKEKETDATARQNIDVNSHSDEEESSSPTSGAKESLPSTDVTQKERLEVSSFSGNIIKSCEGNRPLAEFQDANVGSNKPCLENNEESTAEMEVMTPLNSEDFPLPIENLEENVNIDVTPNPMQSSFSSEKLVDGEESLPTNIGSSKNTIPVVLKDDEKNNSILLSNEEKDVTAFTTTTENDNVAKLEEDLKGHAERENILPGHAIKDHSPSNEAPIKENDIEDDKDRLDHSAPNADHSGNINNHGDNAVSSNLQDDPELAPWRPMLNQVHEILIKPIAEFLPKKGESQRITFIPQDFLLKVPFAALQEAPGRRYLMEDFAVSTSPSIHFLDLACASRKTPEHSTSHLNVLAVGNPEMPFEDLPQLPSAQDEAHMIRDIISSTDSELFIGSQATKKAVMAAMPKHTILHFATHAVIDDSDSHGDFSMKGLVVLAKSGPDCNGLLTAEEVRQMELSAELVVLSCCETALGKVTGDGVLGLSRAFLAAGAACVIVTLWKIDDLSSFKLMTCFYREYKKCRDVAVSLQKGMKILQAEDDTRSPRNWAAFLIVG